MINQKVVMLVVFPLVMLGLFIACGLSSISLFKTYSATIEKQRKVINEQRLLIQQRDSEILEWMAEDHVHFTAAQEANSALAACRTRGKLRELRGEQVCNTLNSVLRGLPLQPKASPMNCWPRPGSWVDVVSQ